MSFWDDVANAPQEEAAAFENLPPNKWWIMRTATTENGQAAPQVRTIESNKTGETYNIFNVGLMAEGGEAEFADGKMRNRTLFFDAFIDPPKDSDMIVSGRFAGFLNAVFSPGVGDDLVTDGLSGAAKKEAEAKRSAVRWANTMRVLAEVAEQDGRITEDNYGGDAAAMIAAAAVAALETDSKLLLVKSRQRKNKETGELRQPDAGAVEDAIQVNFVKRKVSKFADEDGAEELGVPAVAKGPAF